MGNLAGKVAVVTGSSKGIGAATARALAAGGAKVVVNYVQSVDLADEVVRGIVERGGEAIAVKADVSKPGDIEGLFRATHAAFGQLDILVNNAGPAEFAMLDGMTAQHIDTLVDQNFKSVALCTQKAVELFPASGGVVVNVSSETVRNIFSGAAIFAATKSATEVLTRYLAQELGPRNIRIVGVSPGYTFTPATAALSADTVEYMVSRTALRRPGKVGDIASVVAFLVSDEGAWITGTTIAVSGGMNL